MPSAGFEDKDHTIRFLPAPAKTRRTTRRLRKIILDYSNHQDDAVNHLHKFAWCYSQGWAPNGQSFMVMLIRLTLSPAKAAGDVTRGIYWLPYFFQLKKKQKIERWLARALSTHHFYLSTCFRFRRAHSSLKLFKNLLLTENWKTGITMQVKPLFGN